MTSHETKDILIADDSSFFRTKVSDILTKDGHRVLAVEDGKDVIAAIEKKEKQIDLLLLDLNMEQVGGFEVLEWIKENHNEVSFPILVITGAYEASKIMDRLRSMNVSGLMTKGFSDEQIVHRVDHLLFPDGDDERRKPLRIPLSVPVDYVTGKEDHTGHLLSISDTGMFLHTDHEELFKGAHIEFKFKLPASDYLIRVQGIIKWTTKETQGEHPAQGAGVAFEKISDQDKEVIIKYIDTESKKLNIS